MSIRLNRKLILATCIALMASASGCAQEKGHGGLPSVSKSERLSTLSMTDGTLGAIEQSIKSIMLAELSAQKDMLLLRDKQVFEEVLRLIDTLAIQYVNGFKKLYVEAHRKNFNREQTKELIEFFESPLGKLYAKKTEDMIREMAHDMSVLQKRLIDNAMQGGMEIMKKNRNREKNL